LLELRLPESGEKPFAELTRKGIKAAMKPRTPSQASNLLSALRNRLKSSQSGRRSDDRAKLGKVMAGRERRVPPRAEET
jgi:hypothetical protein